MSRAIRALFWEQWKTAGVLSCWIILINSGLGTWLYFLARCQYLNLQDAAELSLLCSACLGLILVAAVVLRVDLEGHLRADVDPRWGRLPLRTGRLVVAPLLMRGLCSFSVVALLLLSHMALFSYAEQVLALLLPFKAPQLLSSCAVGLLALCLYFIIQALSWARPSVLDFVQPAAFLRLAVIAGGICLVLFLLAYHGSYGGWKGFIRLYGLYLFLGLSFCGGAYALYRCPRAFQEARVGAVAQRLSLRAWWEERLEVRQAALAPFRSARDAQVWFERNDAGYHFPGLALLIWLPVALVQLLLRDLLPEKAYPLLFWAPWIALLLAAPFAGMHRASFQPSLRRALIHYTYRHPLQTVDISSARFIARIESLGQAVVLMLGASIFTQIWMRGAELEILLSLWRRGDVAVYELIAAYGAPFLLLCAFAWLLSWIPTRIIGLGFLGAAFLGGGFYLLDYLEIISGVTRSGLHAKSIELAHIKAAYLLVVLGLVPLVLGILSFGLAWQRGGLHTKGLLVGFFVWGAAAAFLILPFYRSAPTGRILLYSLGLAVLPALPIAGVALDVARNRGR